MNSVFGNVDKDYWERELRKDMSIRYPDTLLTVENAQPIKSLIALESEATTGLKLLFKRVLHVTGLEFTRSIVKSVKSNPKHFFELEKPFDDTDLVEISVSMKEIPIISTAEGYIFRVKASEKRLRDPYGAKELLQKAINKFEAALHSSVNSKETLKHAALTCIELISLTSPNATLSLQDPLVDLADQYFLQALRLDPDDPSILACYACMLDRVGDPIAAENNFLQSLEIDPNSKEVLQYYIDFLKSRYRKSEAAQFEYRVKQLKHKERESINIFGLRKKHISDGFY